LIDAERCDNVIDRTCVPALDRFVVSAEQTGQTPRRQLKR